MISTSSREKCFGRKRDIIPELRLAAHHAADN
jgi:hypothetical protein